MFAVIMRLFYMSSQIALTGTIFVL